MKFKSKTIDLKRARGEKMKKMYYFGYYLPLADGLIQSKSKNGNND